MKYKPGFFNLVFLLAVSIAWSNSANATLYEYHGTFTDSNGLPAVLFPNGTTLDGFFDIESPGPFTTSEDPAILASILILANDSDGAPLVCFTSGPQCPTLTGEIGAIAPRVSLSFDAHGNPVAGQFGFTAFSPTFQIQIPVDFDLDTGTFELDFLIYGFAAGVGSLGANVVPLPGGIVLFGPALIALISFRRTR